MCSKGRHLVNFGKIKNGTEMKFSYLWRPKEEMDRITGKDDPA